MVANKPTIKDVARQAGVSIATVSRVMAKKANTYTPQTAQRVWDAAAKLDYQKNSAAAELATRSSDKIAVIVSNPPTNFSTGILDGMQQTALAHISFMPAITVPSCSTKRLKMPRPVRAPVFC